MDAYCVCVNPVGAGNGNHCRRCGKRFQYHSNGMLNGPPTKVGSFVYNLLWAWMPGILGLELGGAVSGIAQANTYPYTQPSNGQYVVAFGIGVIVWLLCWWMTHAIRVSMYNGR